MNNVTKRGRAPRRAGTYGPRQGHKAAAPVDINLLDGKLDTIVRNSFHADAPAVLYHYTTWEGAAGILTSRQFWCTAHDCTNDPAELRTADEIIAEVAAHLQGTRDGPSRYLLDRFRENYSRMKLTKMTPPFIACFSKARDSDSQWQKYADNGSGLCLGISVIAEAIPANDGLGRLLVPVDYSEDSWRERVRTGFAQICSELTALASKCDPVPQRARELGLNAPFRIAAYAAVTAKQPQWSGEEEWRQVVVARKGVEIQSCERQGSRGVIRYLRVVVRQDARPLALAEILIGPNQDAETARRRLGGLLKDAGYPNDFAALPVISVSSSRAGGE